MKTTSDVTMSEVSSGHEDLAEIYIVFICGGL